MLRRFHAPWTVEDNGARFIVRDRNGHALAFVYYEEEPGRDLPASTIRRTAFQPPLIPTQSSDRSNEALAV
jgi:hypothetical protein